ncbi:MAG: PilZ domain-containing protein [Candidatus Lambdaproteobacteria bacterium]|nr:PilZ domain-containing protein [Candidatus Lambdaproteobacteria bacterium]
MNPKILELQQSLTTEFNQTAIMSIMGVLLVALGIALLFVLIRRLPEKAVGRPKAETRLNQLLSELRLSTRDRKALETLCESKNPARQLSMLESRKAFEEIVRDFRTRHADDPAIRQIPALRQKLSYGFGNLRNPFEDTRMLAAGQRIQCTLPVQGEVGFLTTIVGITERFFYLKPPTAKGNPVDLRRFKTLAFRLTREDDAEYTFEARLVGQNPQVVAMDHTGQIQRLLIRHAPRIPVHIDTEFSLVGQEVVSTHVQGWVPEELPSQQLAGYVADLSIGGAMLVVQPREYQPQEGDLLLCKLPPIQIPDAVSLSVLGTVERPDGTLQVHGRFTGMRELQRLKLTTFLDAQQAAAKSGAAAAVPSPA